MNSSEQISFGTVLIFKLVVTHKTQSLGNISTIVLTKTVKHSAINNSLEH